MSDTIIENLSGSKLAVFVISLLVCQLASILIGGLAAPKPVSLQTILATVCKDTSTVENDTTKWFYSRGKGSCKPVNLGLWEPDISESDVVFSFQLPVPRENKILDYSRWQKNLIGQLQIDNEYSLTEVKPRSNVTVDVRLAYRNKGDPDNEWKLYAQSIEERHLDCDIDGKAGEYIAFCEPMPLFALGSLFHDYYLLNVRLVDITDINANLGHIQDIWLTVINQNEGFTKVWVSLKTFFFPCIIATLVWFWRRIHMLERKPILLEKMLLSLGITISILNMPLEYLTLKYDLPYMMVMEDIKQGVFYAMLFSFWLVFVEEHMLIQDESEQSFLKKYWRQLTAVTIGCTPSFIFDIYERYAQLRNPFYSIWSTEFGTDIALTFITFAGIFTGIYFLFLCSQMWQAFKRISEKRQSPPTMSYMMRLNYERLMYRFKFSILATLLCAAITIILFLMEQIAKAQWKWVEYLKLEKTSAFFTGVYGMWNIYIFALLILYAPSNKPVDENIKNTKKFSKVLERLPTEKTKVSSLISFIKKTAIDFEL